MVLFLGVFSSLSLRLPVDHRASAVLFLSTFLVYNLDHVKDLAGSRARVAFFLSSAALAVLLILLATLPRPLGGLVGGGLVAIGLYLFSPRPTNLVLRPAVWVKPAFVGGAVGIAAMSVPLGLAWSAGRMRWGPALAREAVARGLVLSLLCAANALLCDVLDEPSDRREGRTTPAVVHGREAAERAAVGLAFGAVAAAFGAYALGYTRAFDARWGTLSAGLSVALIAWLLPRSLPRYLSVFLIDSTLMLPAAVTLWLGA